MGNLSEGIGFGYGAGAEREWKLAQGTHFGLAGGIMFGSTSAPAYADEDPDIEIGVSSFAFFRDVSVLLETAMPATNSFNNDKPTPNLRNTDCMRDLQKAGTRLFVTSILACFLMGADGDCGELDSDSNGGSGPGFGEGGGGRRRRRSQF